ncbi:hypothetical protein [Naasia aerilata]|uniref:Oxaloacetate decarboxylase n=1 Tax=Naasia aerilata TaxID=1162966 RepID=A0ABN6XRJ9_9MICO|nr:hypothetical protein [Naasia aerilata]BDZ46215.1 hypothetical protein GCM10025866_21240 [Naasia aerilata]
MKPVVVTDVPRPPQEQLDELAEFGVATVHEAMGRSGMVGPIVRPIQQDARIAGSAVTVLCWPGDNLMIHAAVEQCRPGDVLVVTTVSPPSTGRSASSSRPPSSPAACAASSPRAASATSRTSAGSASPSGRVRRTRRAP